MSVAEKAYDYLAAKIQRDANFMVKWQAKGTIVSFAEVPIFYFAVIPNDVKNNFIADQPKKGVAICPSDNRVIVMSRITLAFLSDHIRIISDTDAIVHATSIMIDLSEHELTEFITWIFILSILRQYNKRFGNDFVRIPLAPRNTFQQLNTYDISPENIAHDVFWLFNVMGDVDVYRDITIVDVLMTYVENIWSFNKMDHTIISNGSWQSLMYAKEILKFFTSDSNLCGAAENYDHMANLCVPASSGSGIIANRNDPQSWAKTAIFQDANPSSPSARAYYLLNDNNPLVADVELLWLTELQLRHAFRQGTGETRQIHQNIFCDNGYHLVVQTGIMNTKNFKIPTPRQALQARKKHLDGALLKRTMYPDLEMPHDMAEEEIPTLLFTDRVWVIWQ